MNIFSDRVGRSVLIQDAGLPLSIALGDGNGIKNAKAVVTGVSLNAAENVQFLTTLRDFVYVYVFGERMTETSISGVAFAGDCEAGGASGVELLWDYFQQNRVGRRGTTLGLAIGSRISFQGFLVGFGFNLADPISGLAQWNMKFVFHPQEAAGA